MFEGQESKRLDVMLEFYRQASLNMRMFVDMRFKHFTTLIVITGILGAAAFNIQAIAAWRPYIQIVAVAVTLLFWLVDYRTSQYWRHEFAKVQTFERALNEGVHLMLPPAEKIHIRSSTATNLLFAVLVLVWSVTFIIALIAPAAVPVAATPSANPAPAPSAQQNAPNPTLKRDALKRAP